MTGHGHRVVGIDGFLVRPALNQANAFSIFNINSGNDFYHNFFSDYLICVGCFQILHVSLEPNIKSPGRQKVMPNDEKPGRFEGRDFNRLRRGLHK
jgi:hypothetical protein